jgi:uncharacterized protein (DUF1800 family)
MGDDRPLIAHLLRRATFGPFPGQVDALAPLGLAGALDSVLGGAPVPVEPFRGGRDDDPSSWLWQHLISPKAGLHEKLTWFWHGHFTSGYSKVGLGPALVNQNLLLRRHAFGNFRTFVREITIDPAMLLYLDGDASTADSPNENYARELMELFTLGRGHYSEADVRAGARALAGWRVDDNEYKVIFDEESANRAQVTFLGRSGALRYEDIANIVCDQPACAPFIVGKLHRYFVGTEPPEERRAELAAIFSSSGLEIRPVVEAIFRHPSFAEQRLNRPRFPVEWAIAAAAALGATPDIIWAIALGQYPLDPPNVAGWPPGNRWLSAGLALTRLAFAASAEAVDEISRARDPVAAALHRSSLYEVTGATRHALDELARSTKDPEVRSAALLGMAVASPEFALA